MHLPSASKPSQLDSTEGVGGHGCAFEHAVQKHPQWEVVLRLACLSLSRLEHGWLLAFFFTP